MLGLLILYFIAKPFYKLAERYNRSPIGYSVLAIVVYYAATIITGFAILLFVDSVSPGMFIGINDTLLGILFIPFGLLALYFFYNFLEKHFRDNDGGGMPQDDLLDAQLIK